MTDDGGIDENIASLDVVSSGENIHVSSPSRLIIERQKYEELESVNFVFVPIFCKQCKLSSNHE